MSPENEPSKICHCGKDRGGVGGWVETLPYSPPQPPEIRDAHHIFPFPRFKRKYKVKLVEKRAYREIQ